VSAADLRDDAALVISELISNARLHGQAPVSVRVLESDQRVRIEVTDAGTAFPVRLRHSEEAMTGRGLRLVAAVSQNWGVEPLGSAGKVVWAELSVPSAAEHRPPSGDPDAGLDALLAELASAGDVARSEQLYTVQLGAVPTEFLLAAKSHIDDVVRELELVSSHAGSSGEPLPAPERLLIDAVTKDFAPARNSIKRQALESAGRGELVTELTLQLPLSAADAGERYLAALDEIDRQSRSARMLTLAPPRSHVAFRRWYLRGVIDQLRAAARGESLQPPEPFPQVLAEQVDELAALLETQTRLRLLQSITRRLTEASSVGEMAEVVADRAGTYEGVRSVRVLLRTDHDTLKSFAWHGGPSSSDVPDEVSLQADLPVSWAARSGQRVHARTMTDAYRRFPALEAGNLYAEDRSLHAVPLTIAGNVIGVLMVTFRVGDVADETQQEFVTAIAYALAQAIERGLAKERADAERRRELALIEAQTAALASVIAGTPLVTVLDTLLLALESASTDGMLVSVLLVGEDGRRLRHGAAPSLPAEYSAAVDGLDIGPRSGSCGTAAYRRQRVIVEDVTTDPLWTDYRELAELAGLRACWSTPITGSDGELLGTLAAYYRRPHVPSVADMAFIDVIVGTVALIIESSRANPGHISDAKQQDLREEAAARLALELAVSAGGIGTFDWDLVTGELTWDEQLLEIFGFSRDDSRVRTIDTVLSSVHPDDQERVSTLLNGAIAEIGEYDAEYRILLPDGTTRWVTVRGRAFAGREGRAIRMLGAAQDTTMRRNAELRVARVMDAMSTAFFFLDPQWRFSFLNGEAERVLGRPRAELIGRSLWDEFPASAGSDFDIHYRHAVTTGQPVAFDAYYPDPLDAWYEVRAWPSPDGLAVYFVDVTHRRAAQEAAQQAISRARLLARISEELTGTLDSRQAMQSLAQILTPTLADWCVITIIEDDRLVGTRRGLGEAVGWHTEPHLREVVDRYARIRLAQMTDHALIVRAVETAVPQIINGDALPRLQGMFPSASEPMKILEDLDTYAIAVLPLIGQERPVGMLSVVNSRGRGPFSEGDLDLIRDAAARAGLVLDRARLYRQQRAVAETLQRSLLQPPPDNEHVQIAVAYVPAAEVAQVGGDWYDAFNQPDGATTLIIGDVMGHDLLAAAAMGETRMLMRTLAAQQAGAPARTLEAAESVMHQLQSETIATVLVGRLEPVRKSDAGETAHLGATRFSFSNAGHPPPLLLHADGRVDLLDGDTVDPLLGVARRPRSEHVVTVTPGATLVLYTDGLVERRDQPIGEGIDRLRKTLSQLTGVTPEQLRDAVLQRMLPERREDDVALLVVRAGVTMQA
jgi:PAS domain S-box-containing protein